MRLREISIQDCDLLYSWRNLPNIIALSSSQKKVSLNEHKLWFARLLSKENVYGFIIEDTLNIPIGHLRFDQVESKESTITIYLMPTHTGHGIGTNMIINGCAIAIDQLNQRKIYADVRMENISAQTAFLKAGFKSCNPRKTENHLSFVLESTI